MKKSELPVFLRSPYNYNREEASTESGLHCEDVSQAQQHCRDECDINTIMTRFGQTGLLPENPLPPRYGDFSEIGDYHSALNAVRVAETEFDALPAGIRARFDNDPANLIGFLDDINNREEAISLGLIPKPEVTGSPSEPPKEASADA